MKWTKITIRTTEEAEEMVTAMLMGLGIDQIEIENNMPPSDEEFQAMYIDPQPELMPDNEAVLPEGVSLVRFYAEDGENIDELIENVDNGLIIISQYADIGMGTIELEESLEDDWRNNWKKFYKPLLINDILIKPSWEPVPEEFSDKIEAGELKLIEMEPGTAFGTGTHETTRLCVDGLDKYIEQGDAVLDIGTGSGILGLCALKQGASWVMATELDPDCEHVILDNLAMNEVNSEQFVLSIGNILDDERVIGEVNAAAEDHGLVGGYDILVANILAPVIVALFEKGQADSFVKKGGIFVTSGIIDEKEEDVVKALEANPAWELVEVVHLGEWVSVVARAI